MDQYMFGLIPQLQSSTECTGFIPDCEMRFHVRSLESATPLKDHAARSLVDIICRDAKLQRGALSLESFRQTHFPFIRRWIKTIVEYIEAWCRQLETSRSIRCILRHLLPIKLRHIPKHTQGHILVQSTLVLHQNNLPLTRQETHIILLVVEECPLQRHELYFLQGNISPKKPAIYILQIIFAAEYIAEKRIFIRSLCSCHTPLPHRNISFLYSITSAAMAQQKTSKDKKLCARQNPRTASKTAKTSHSFVISLPNHFSETFAIVPSARISSSTFCIFSLSAVSSLR